MSSSRYTPPRAQVIIERVLMAILSTMCFGGIGIAVSYLVLYHR